MPAKRKVKPAELKARAETFVARAASNKPTTSNTSISRKRKRGDYEDDDHFRPSAITLEEPGSIPTPSKKSKSKLKSGASDMPIMNEEKRLRRYREKAPKTFLQKLLRAQTQRYRPNSYNWQTLKSFRMIVIGRARTVTDAFLCEEIDIVGSTGNIYKVIVGQIPSCTCPDHLKGNECKHKVYALHTVLKAPEHLQYQLAYLSSELREIFDGAPPIPTEASSSQDTDGNRKAIEGECPICYFDLDEEHNELVWCRAACGNNVHKSCFDQWAASQRGASVKCVYCRTSWQVDPGDLRNIKQAGSVSEDGYVNVAEHFGMSGVRDYGTYHQPWVRRNYLGTGW